MGGYGHGSRHGGSGYGGWVDSGGPWPDAPRESGRWVAWWAAARGLPSACLVRRGSGSAMIVAASSYSDGLETYSSETHASGRDHGN